MSELFSDPFSLANIAYFKINHIDWSIDVDFPSETLKCHVVQKFECVLSNDVGVLLLDTRDLAIDNVKVGDRAVNFKLLTKNDKLGQALEISLPLDTCILGATFDLSITYQTSPKASATQWLLPAQTLGKKHPYLYTQCQTIHARSLLPCQDSPGSKFSYSAEVTVPENMVALMSAIKGEETVIDNGRKVCLFKQSVPIPSYLLAIAVAALECRTVGPRSTVWCEEEMIDACEYEFGQVDEILQYAESLMGPYVWGVYDMLILPPSFPFGGMENPCLTFLSPTIITGDRSLISLMIHEITHSWTGNLVNNSTWKDFWLNEGLTTFIEGKINGLLDGEPHRQFIAIGGWYLLLDCIKDFGDTNKLTALLPEADDPDDFFSPIPYEKGAAFLYYIENLVGGAEVFNPFLKAYIDHYKPKAINTEDFKQYLLEYFDDKKDVLNQIDWNTWLYAPGMPPVDVIALYDTTLANSCKVLADKWLDYSPVNLDSFKEEEFSSFTMRQKISFLTILYHERPLGVDRISKMAEVYNLFSTNVCELKYVFLKLCVSNKWVESYQHAVHFLLEHGRMKFTRPLYKEMFKHEESRQLAIDTYKQNSHIYHPIASNLTAKDLQLVE